MLSYVIPETGGSNGSPGGTAVGVHRNGAQEQRLSLNLNLTNVGGNVAELLDNAAVAAEACDDENTRLLSEEGGVAGGTPQNARRQCLSSNNNSRSSFTNNYKTNNNNATTTMGVDGNRQGGGLHTGAGSGSECGGGGGGDADTLSEEDAVTNSEEFSSDKQELPLQSSATVVSTTTTSLNTTITSNKKPPKLSKLGSKTVGLKRVSFGSSKGSMVETLVFETPTPLSEHVEPTFGFDSDVSPHQPQYLHHNQQMQQQHHQQYQQQYHPNSTHPNSNLYSKVNMDDSGIEVQEDSERSIVRVSIYQSSQPQHICPPDYLTRFDEDLDNTYSNYNLEDIMTTTTSTIPGYDRQMSTDSGWENPFRPGGDLSREADEIVNMIKGGKPITPTEDHTVGNGNAQKHANGNGTTIHEEVTKTNMAPNQTAAQNGTNNSHSRVPGTTTATGKPTETNGTTTQVSKQVVPGPTSASHVVIDEKKNKKKGCCVIQ